MKKRLLSLVLCLVMVVSLCPFGAFASVYKVTGSGEEPLPMEVVFYYNGNERSTQYLSDDEGTVFDPGVPDLERNQTFQGWCLTESLEGDSMTINQVNDYVHTNFASGGKVELYAKVFDTYYVTYLADEGTDDDDEDLIVVQKVDPVNVPVGTASYTYTVDASYTPPEESKAFEGWYYDSTTPLQSGEVITVNPAKDITLTADVVDGFWAVFDENEIVNGANIHASYVPPVFVKTDADPIDITADAYKPTATGYTFQGWFDSKTGGHEVTTLDNLTEKTTVYAHWTPVSTADYTVIIWQQSIDDDVNATTKTYDFAEKVVLSGTPGDPINTVESRGSGNSAYALIDGVSKQYEGFHLADYDTGKTIAPQGNTVVNVYYDRNQHTLTFRGYVYTLTPTTSDNGTQYGLIDGQFVKLTRVDEGWIWTDYHWYYNGVEYTGTRYVVSDSTLETIKEITALYRQPIGDNFPIVGADGTEYKTSRWDPQSSTPYNEVLVYIDTMPDADVTFNQDTNCDNTIYMHYYVEALPGQTATRTYNGKGFVEYDSIDANYNFFTEAEDYIPLVGFTKSDSYPPEGYNENGSQNNTIWGSTDAADIVYCYYIRNKYDIVYKDGVYVKKSGSTEISAGDYPAGNDYNTVQGIFYQQDISDYGAYVPENANYDGFMFAGWYKDPRCQNPYVFEDETMPAHNVAVYAKWMQIQYHVDLQLNGGRTSTSTSFNVDWHEQVSPDVPTRAGYMFAGWYTDENFEHPYSTDTKVDSETQGMVLREDTSDGVFGDLTLHAKWRKILDDASYISVEYSADYGEAPNDSRQYADLTLTNAAPAPTGVAEDADNTNHQIFECWALLDVENNEIGYYFPGQHFTVSAENAVRTVIDADHSTYTVRLKAIYTTPASAAKTFLKYDLNGGGTFDANHGGAATYTIDNIPINSKQTLLGEEAFDAVKPFLGWNHDQSKANEGVVEFTAGELVGVDTLPDERNTLFAVWEKTTPATYLIDFGAQMKLAENGSIMKGTATEKNGKFSIVDGAAVYQLLANKEDKTIAGGADLTMSGVDSATIRGNFYVKDSETGAMVTEAKAAWKDVTVVPASSVYFDDDLTQLTATENGVGFNGEVGMLKEETPAVGTFTFTFTGSRIDIYCTTDGDAQAVTAVLKEGDTVIKRKAISNKYQDEQIGALYNVPSVVFEAKDGVVAGHTYTVTLTAKQDSNYKLDGVRVYKAVAETGDVKTAYENAQEANSTFLKVRDYLLTSSMISTLNQYLDDRAAYNALEDKDGVEPPTEPEIIPGIAFYKDVAYVEGADQYAKLADYVKTGPKNEIYLAKDEVVSFAIKNCPNNMQVWIGLSAPAGDTGTVEINDVTYTPDIDSTVDMYYKVTPKEIEGEQTLKIKNIGDSLISITNVKITGSNAANPSLNAKVLSVAEAEPAEDGAPYLAVTPKLLARMSAPAQAEDPQPTPTADPEPTPTADPEPTPTQPGFAEWISNLFSSFVNALFGSISRLFGN